jgi:hypothetical protein
MASSRPREVLTKNLRASEPVFQANKGKSCAYRTAGAISYGVYRWGYRSMWHSST